MSFADQASPERMANFAMSGFVLYTLCGPKLRQIQRYFAAVRAFGSAFRWDAAGAKYPVIVN